MTNSNTEMIEETHQDLDKRQQKASPANTGLEKHGAETNNLSHATHHHHNHHHHHHPITTTSPTSNQRANTDNSSTSYNQQTTSTNVSTYRKEASH
jgi:hypothetical protein